VTSVPPRREIRRSSAVTLRSPIVRIRTQSPQGRRAGPRRRADRRSVLVVGHDRRAEPQRKHQDSLATVTAGDTASRSTASSARP